MKHFIYLLLLILFINCKETKQNPNQLNIKQITSERIKQGWKKYSDGKISALIPPNWKPTKDSTMLFLVPIDQNLNLYYAVFEYEIKSVKSSKNYIQETFKQISANNPKFNYKIKKLDFTNGKRCYILEIDTTENNNKYKTHIVIYETDNKLFDFGFKTISDPKTYSENGKIFFEVLFSLEKENRKIIDSENFIVKNAVEINYEDL